MTDEVQTVLAELDDEGQRLDNFLIRQLKGVPKSRIYRLLRTGEVRVNKGRKRPEYRLKIGDLVRIPPVRQASQEEVDTRLAAQVAKVSVLYEDEELLLINKPSGVAVHSGSGIRMGLIEALRQNLGPNDFLELAHRLDRETSGCLLFAKRRSVLRTLQQLGQQGKTQKQYCALVRGHWPWGRRTVTLALEKSTLASGEQVVSHSNQGKIAISHFEPIEFLRQASLMRVDIETGRTHQIRVHAKALGHPIAADPKYGDPHFNELCREAGLKRLFLHAARLAFPHPKTQQLIDVLAPLPTDLQAVLDRWPRQK